MTCPDCLGEGRSVCIGCPGFIRISLPCRSCDGSGFVDEAFLARRHMGAQIRAARMTRDLSLREAAKRLDVSSVALSDAERGLTDPTALLERVRRL